MFRKTKTVAIFTFFVLPISASANWFGPDNYEDCVLEGIPEAKTDLAVKIVMATCRDKFPSEKKESKTNKPISPDSTGNPLGEYVCQFFKSNSIVNIFVDEDSNQFLFNNTNRKIANSTGSAIYTGNWDAEGNTYYLVFKRIKNPQLMDNKKVRIELRGTSKSGKLLSYRGSCEKSTSYSLSN
mgnify:CR=1 FL=1